MLKDQQVRRPINEYDGVGEPREDEQEVAPPVGRISPRPCSPGTTVQLSRLARRRSRRQGGASRTRPRPDHLAGQHRERMAAASPLGIGTSRWNGGAQKPSANAPAKRSTSRCASDRGSRSAPATGWRTRASGSQHERAEPEARQRERGGADVREHHARDGIAGGVDEVGDEQDDVGVRHGAEYNPAHETQGSVASRGSAARPEDRDMPALRREQDDPVDAEARSQAHRASAHVGVHRLPARRRARRSGGLARTIHERPTPATDGGRGGGWGMGPLTTADFVPVTRASRSHSGAAVSPSRGTGRAQRTHPPAPAASPARSPYYAFANGAG